MKSSRYPSDLCELVTVEHVCRAIKVSRRTLQRMLHLGTFPKPDRRVGRGLRWRKTAVEAWIDEGT